MCPDLTLEKLQRVFHGTLGRSTLSLAVFTRRTFEEQGFERGLRCFKAARRLAERDPGAALHVAQCIPPGFSVPLNSTSTGSTDILIELDFARVPSLNRHVSAFDIVQKGDFVIVRFTDGDCVVEVLQPLYNPRTKVFSFKGREVRESCCVQQCCLQFALIPRARASH